MVQLTPFFNIASSKIVTAVIREIIPACLSFLSFFLSSFFLSLFPFFLSFLRFILHSSFFLFFHHSFSEKPSHLKRRRVPLGALWPQFHKQFDTFRLGKQTRSLQGCHVTISTESHLDTWVREEGLHNQRVPEGAGNLKRSAATEGIIVVQVNMSVITLVIMSVIMIAFKGQRERIVSMVERSP